MKKRKASPVVTVATAALISTAPVLAVPSNIPPAMSLETVPGLVVDSKAGTTNLKRLKKKAMLAKHDLLSERNRVEQVRKPAPPTLDSPPNRETAMFLETPSPLTTALPATSPANDAYTSEFAVLSDTLVKARRPSGIDRRKDRTR
jgi:hypothetical protein